MDEIRIIPSHEVNAENTWQKLFLVPIIILSLIAGISLLYFSYENIKSYRIDIPHLIIQFIGGVFFSVGSIIALWKHYVTDEYYIPGKTFLAYRSKDNVIVKRYRLLLWLGVAAAIIGLIGGFLLKGLFYKVAIAGAIIGYLGYRGGIAKSAHGDIDYSAVETLREEGLITDEKVYASYQNFDSSDDEGNEGDIALVFLADGMIAFYCAEDGWYEAHKKFSEITELGISTGQDMSFFILMRFDDETQLRLSIDPSLRLSTDPASFTRQFLEILDASLTSGALGRETNRRRRVVVEDNPSLPSSATLQRTAEDDRRLELPETSKADVKKRDKTGSGRALELDL